MESGRLHEVISGLWSFLQNQVTLTLAVIASTVMLSLLITRWNRHRATVDLACRWNDGEVEAIRGKFRNLVPWEANVRYTRKSMDELAKNTQARAHLVTLLNHLDIAATGWCHKLFDKESFQHLYAGLLRDFYCKYADFMWRTYQLSIGMEEEDLTSIDEAGPGTPYWPQQRPGRVQEPRPSMEGTYAYLLVKGEELSRDRFAKMPLKDLKLSASG